MQLTSWMGKPALVALTVALMATTWAAGAGSAAAPSADASLADIDRLIGDAACSDSTDCRVIGIGAKACGGPEAYRAWSASRTAAPALEDLVTRNAARRRSELRRLGMASTCSIAPVPAVICQRPDASQTGATCTLQPARAGS